MRSASLIGLLGFMLLVFIACGGGTGAGDAMISPDAIPDGVEVVVETEVSSNLAVVGEPITVTCSVTAGGISVDTGMVITVEGTERFDQIDSTLTFQETGTFQVACRAPDMDLTDPTPETVDVMAGRPATIDTEVEPATITAGEIANVRCVVLDSGGNILTGHTVVTADPSAKTDIEPGASVDTFTFKARTAGAYDLTCAMKDDSVVDGTPAKVQVVPGAIAKVVTGLADDTILAGGSTTATCDAFDMFDNLIPDAELVVNAPPEIVVNGYKVGGTVAGKWDITCVPADESSAELEKAILTIEALEAVGLALFLVPDKPHYFLYDQVKVGYSMVDKYGNRVPGGAITPIDVDPDQGIRKVSDDQFQFQAEGSFTFSACLDDDSGWCDDVTAWCDGTPPVIAIEYPPRGATIEGSRRVVVTGTVADAVGGMGALVINGEPVPVGEYGHFDFPMDAVQGMNLIDATARDRFGNELRTIRSFLFSYDWYPADTGDPVDSKVPYSLKAYLDDKLFYNPDSSDEGTLSALLNMALQDLDLLAVIPSPATSFEQIGCGYDLTITKVTYKTPDVKIRTVDNGLRLDVTIPDLKADFRLDKVKGGGLCPGTQTGSVTADNLKVGVRIVITVDTVTNRIRISTAGGTQVVLENLKVNVDSWFYNLLTTLLRGVIEDLARNEFEKIITDTINDLDKTVNDLLAEPLEIPIGPLFEGAPQNLLRIHLFPESGKFDSEGGALDIGVAIMSPKIVDRTILGTIARSACLTGIPENFQFDISSPEKILLAVFDDVLSQAAFAFWNNGGLHLHLTSETLAEMGTDLSSYGIQDLDVKTMPLLPPIVTGCTPDEMLTAQVGDFYVEVSMDMFGTPTVLHLFMFLEVPVELYGTVDPEDGPSIAIQVHEPTLTEIDLVYINEDWVGQEYIFIDLFYGALFPLIFDQIKDPFLIQLPTLNLKDLLGGDEEGGIGVALPDKDLVIDVKSIGRTKGFTTVDAGILIQAPAP
jgi:hypothetical protein